MLTITSQIIFVILFIYGLKKYKDNAPSKPRYKIHFDPEYYDLSNAKEIEIVTTNFFSDDLGYGDEEREQVNSLAIGSKVYLDSGYQSVERVA